MTIYNAALMDFNRGYISSYFEKQENTSCFGFNDIKGLECNATISHVAFV